MLILAKDLHRLVLAISEKPSRSSRDHAFSRAGLTKKAPAPSPQVVRAQTKAVWFARTATKRQALPYNMVSKCPSTWPPECTTVHQAGLAL